MTYALCIDDLTTGRAAARHRIENPAPVENVTTLKPATKADINPDTWGMGKRAYEQQQAALRALGGGG